MRKPWGNHIGWYLDEDGLDDCVRGRLAIA